MQFVRGNLLEAPVEALVNAVNEVGVMGKDLALQFRTAFPPVPALTWRHARAANGDARPEGTPWP